MSAFVVDDSTIDRIVTFLGHSDHDYLARIFRPLGYNPATEPEAFAQALFDMNCKAVDQRYPDHPARRYFHPEPYRHQTNFNCADIGVLKAAGCLRYQCSEGDVPETPLFKALDDFIGALAYHVVCGLPEYEKAEWG